jgi:hypothetical protein
MIHLGVHLHLITYGKCREAMEETKMLIKDEVNQKVKAKTLGISLKA